MNEVHVRVNDKGQHVPYRLVSGLYTLDIGPAFRTPREAIDYANRLEAMPIVSPLRSPGGRSTGSAAPPVLLGAEVDRPPGAPRQGTSRPGRMTGRE